MKKKRFDLLLTLVSFLVAFGVYGAGLSLIVRHDELTPIARACAVGGTLAVPPIAALLLMHAAARIRRSVRVKLPHVYSPLPLLAMILVFGSGTGGQYLYSYRAAAGDSSETTTTTTETTTTASETTTTKPETTTTTTTTKQETTTTKKTTTTTETTTTTTTTTTEPIRYDNSHLILLIDDSGSMSDHFANARKVAGQFINALPEDVYAGIGVFSTEIYYHDMLEMNDSGKATLKDYIDQQRLAGQTDYDKVLQYACDRLLEQSPDKTRNSVVMVTDGHARLSQEITDLYLDNGIGFYSIRYTANESELSQKFVEFVQKAGGSDILIGSGSSSDSAVQQLARSFSVNAATSSSMSVMSVNSVESDEDEDTGTILYDESITLRGVLIRAAVILLAALLIQLYYFRRMSIGACIGTLLFSIGAGAVMTYAAVLPSIWIAAAAVSLLLFTAFVRLEVTDGGTTDV